MKDKGRKVKTFVEPSLKDSELRYRRLFEAAQDGILILDAKTGAITDVNPYLIDMLGYSRDEFMGKKLWEVGAFKDIKASQEAFKGLQKDTYIRYEDLPLKAKDGHLVEVEFVSNVYSVNSDKVIQCNIRNINDRKQAEERTREHETRYRLLFDNASIGILLIDRQGKILEVNPAALQILGSPSAEATKNINILTFQPLIEAGISADYQKVLDNAQFAFGEYPYTTKWGKSIFVSARLTPLFGANGNLEQIQAIIVDTTDRKRGEKALRESEDKFKYVFDNSVVGKSITFISGEFNPNKALCEMLGYTSEELQNRKWEDITHLDDIELTQKEINSLLAGEKESAHFVKRYLHKNGTVVWTEVSTSLRRDEDDKPLYLITTILDITERKQAEDALQESENKYRILVDTLSEGIALNEIIYDEHGEMVDYRIIEVNPAFYSMADFQGTVIGNVATQLYGMSSEEIRSFGQAHKQLETTAYADYLSPLKGLNYLVATSPFVNGRFVTSFFDITERKHAEDLLRSSEEKWRSLVTSTPDYISLLDSQFRYLFLNHYADGFSEKEVIGRELFDFVSPESKELFRMKMEACISTQAIQKFEFDAFGDGRNFRTYEQYLVPIKGTGEEINVMAIARDITERKQAEEEMRFLASIIESADDAIIGKTLEGIVLSWNRGAEKLYGYSAQEAVGQPISIIAPPEKFNEIPGLLEKVSRGEKVEHYETVRLTRAGKRVDVSLTISPMRDHDGRVVAASTIARNISERKQAEEKLATSEAELRSLFASMTDAVMVLDADGRYIKIAPTNLINLFHPPDEMLGKTVHEVLPKEQADYIVTKTREAIQTGRVVPGEYALQIGGKEIWFSSNATRLSENTAMWVAHDFTDRKQAEAAISQRFVELATLYESGLTLSRLLSPKEIGQKLIELMGSKMNWHHTTIRLYHSEDESLELLAFNLPERRSTAEFREAEQRFKTMISKAGEGLSGWAVQHQQSVRVGDLSQDPRYIEVEPGLLSGLYVPLKVGEHLVGVISIESEKPQAFDEADERLMITLANQAAVALENGRLHEETLHQLKQLQALHTIDRTIAGSFDQGMMLDVLMTQSLSQLDIEAAAIFLIQPHQRGALQYVAGQGFNTGLIQIASLKLGNSIAGEAAVRREMIHIREPDQSEPDPLLSKLWSEEGFKCMEAIPLISKGEVKGVMTVFHRKDFMPNPAWSSFFETLAGQAAIALDITQMFDNLQRANMQLAVAYEATIEGWSQALDLRDKETEGHSQRVTEMTIQMGKALQLNVEEINHMRRGALLHDIGKLGVPDQILLKVEKLTDEEWLIMKKHPEFAYDMLHSITYLRDSLDIPYCHHEKWDGSGYPQGLKGEQIPLAARIFAVIDVWDALTSDRPYREAWSKTDVMQYIRDQSDKHFDPKIVDVFLEEFGTERLAKKAK